MYNNSNGMARGIAIVSVILIIIFAGGGISLSEPKCAMSGCNGDAVNDSSYCTLHDISYRSYGNPDYGEVYERSHNNEDSYSSNSYSSSISSSTDDSYSDNDDNSNETKYTYSSSTYKKHYTYVDTYDDGYNDVYEDDDYDWDRYMSDDDYASGVDDAMEDEEW